MLTDHKSQKLVGHRIKQRREELGLSQRQLGSSLQPAVTTQFISNVERGVTPLPPAHVVTLCKALQINEQEIFCLLERETVLKLKASAGMPGDEEFGIIPVSPEDAVLFGKIYRAFCLATPEVKAKFITANENLLSFSQICPKTGLREGSS